MGLERFFQPRERLKKTFDLFLITLGKRFNSVVLLQGKKQVIF